ncbi:MAG: exopolysaccharide biosynthesis protein [Roseinatronobacter sp.]
MSEASLGASLAGTASVTLREQPVQDMVQQLRVSLTTGPEVTVEAVLRAMTPAAQPVFLLLPALILVTPISGIPGLSSLGGLVILLVALQILLGRRAIWLPGFILRRRLSVDRLRWALDKLARPAAFIDRKARTRAAWAVQFPLWHLALMLCMLCGMLMPALELIPFSATTLAMVVTILASALLVRDGVLLMLGLGGFALAMLGITLLVSG